MGAPRGVPPRRRGAALAGLCALGLAATAAARPLTLEDLLARDDIGQVRIAAGGRWLVVERRGPVSAAGRWDGDLLNDLYRTTPMVANLDHPAGLRPLVRKAPGVGYQVGPLSPDGARAVLFRLHGDSWSLGVATLATRTVRWLPITPELGQESTSVQWASATDLVVLARTDSRLPWLIRGMRPWTDLPARWAASAQGAGAHSLHGGGRFEGAGERPAPTQLIRLDARTGRARVLATGGFIDLEVSASGRVAAVLERGEDVALRPGEQVHGDFGVETQRKRLRIIDIATGRATTPCPDCDVLESLLAWAPHRDDLLIFARSDGAPWPAGRLLQIDAGGGQPHELASTAVTPLVEGRPGIVRAGWWGDDPIVYGRASGAREHARSDWWRLTAGAAIPLTGALPASPGDAIAVTDKALIASVGGKAWAVDRAGAAREIADGGAAFRPTQDGLRARSFYSRDETTPLLAREDTPEGARIRDLSAAGAPALTLPAGAEVVAFDPARRGAVIRAPIGGGAAQLQWTAAGQAPVSLAILAPGLRDVAQPQALAVRHAGPNGEALTSWLYLPPRSRDGRPPSLIVYPYPGRAFATPPREMALAWGGGVYPPALLLGHGYAVLIPSLPTARNGKGPAEGLAAQTLAIVDVAARQPGLAGAFDPDRLGVLGHSFGGYAVMAMLPQTQRFRTGVAMAGPSSLFSKWGAFGLSGRIEPEEGSGAAWSIGWVESLQGGMGVPPWADPQRYVRNSPLLQADKIVTPLLIVQGEHDSMALDEGERMYSALFRQGKDVELLTYWGEGHIIANPANLRDLYSRIFAWLDAALTPSQPERVAQTASPAPAPASAGPRTRPLRR